MPNQSSLMRPEELHVAAEARNGTRGVVLAATGSRREAAVPADDEIDERLTGDDDPRPTLAHLPALPSQVLGHGPRRLAAMRQRVLLRRAHLADCTRSGRLRLGLEDGVVAEAAGTPRAVGDAALEGAGPEHRSRA